MKISAYKKKIINLLQPLYDEREAAAVARTYLQGRLQCEAYKLVLQGGEELTTQQVARFDADLERMRQGCPVQYVLGMTEFYGYEFEVNASTLIPRPETEELVQLVIRACDEHTVLPSKRTIWDVGTGSGCIAIALALSMHEATIFATDISTDALQMARSNAARLGADVRFACHDMMDITHLPFGEQRFDVVVSNPPYIPRSVRESMHPNVRNFEPDVALFVPDEDPFLFYKALRTLCLRVLKPGGCAIFEIFDQQAAELTDLFREDAFDQVSLYPDVNGRPRMLYLRKTIKE